MWVRVYLAAFSSLIQNTEREKPMKQFTILMLCFTQLRSVSQGQDRPVDKVVQVGIRNMRLTIASIVKRYNARRKKRSAPKLVFRPIFGEDQLSGYETRIPKNNRLLVIPVPDIPKDKTLAPFASKPEHARFALTIPAPGIQFGAINCGRRTRVMVGTFAGQIVQWAAYLANAETKSLLPWRIDAPLGLDQYYVSKAEFAKQKKKNADADANARSTQEGKQRSRCRLMKVDHLVD